MNKASAFLGSFFVLLIITTLVLPNRQTPAAITSLADLLSSSVKHVTGQ